MPTATAQVFGQSLFAPAGKSLFEVRPTTIIIGGLAIPFGGPQPRQKKVNNRHAGTYQPTNFSYKCHIPRSNVDDHIWDIILCKDLLSDVGLRNRADEADSWIHL